MRIKNWEEFPYKLDYMLYDIYSKCSTIAMIVLLGDNFYSIVRAIANEVVEPNELYIPKNELLHALNIPTEQSYETKIFTTPNKFLIYEFKPLETIIQLQLVGQWNAELNDIINDYTVYDILDLELEKKGKDIKK